MKNKTNSSLILAVCIALITIGGFFYGVSYVDGLSMKTAELKSEVEVNQIKISHIQSVNKSAEKTSEDAIKIGNHFIKSNGSIDFVSQVESVATDFSLKYNTNSIENIEHDMLTSQGKDLLKISMTLSGGWSNILKFISYIESLPYSVRIEKVDLAAEGAVSAVAENTIAVATKNPSWKLSITFSVVKIKENSGR